MTIRKITAEIKASFITTVRRVLLTGLVVLLIFKWCYIRPIFKSQCEECDLSWFNNNFTLYE